MRREGFLLLSLITLAASLIGILGGLDLGRRIRPRVVSTQAIGRPLPANAAPSPTPADHVAILLLGVDSLAAEPPQLQACWVVILVPSARQYFFIGFSPDSQASPVDGEAPQTLRQIYQVDDRLDWGAVFTQDTLQEISPGLLEPQVTVVFDRQILAQAVDKLGGFTLRGQEQDGQSLLALYDALPAGASSDRLRFEGEVLEALWQAAKDQNWSPEMLIAYLSLGQQWYPDYETMAGLARVAPPFSEAQYTITYAPLTRPEATAVP
ncbi:MAG: hypothetical protein ACRDH2_02490 [Anaerolineales bacterium]